MADETRQKWDDIYGADSRASHAPGDAARVLTENSHLLPAQGRALEIACGRGANAMWLARHGLQVDAWDISPVVIEQLNASVAQQGLSVSGQARDVMQQPPPAASYDVIIVSHFLERGLLPLLRQALRPAGLLYYQTFTQARVSDRGPTKAEYRLVDNELLHLCDGLQILVYREEGRVGALDQGWRDLAMIVAQQR